MTVDRDDCGPGIVAQAVGRVCRLWSGYQRRCSPGNQLAHIRATARLVEFESAEDIPERNIQAYCEAQAKVAPPPAINTLQNI
jgi:hypothetical protein